MRRAKPAIVSLVEPSLAGLDAYAGALGEGWSPDSERDASAERLTALMLDPVAFLRDISGQERTIALDDGSVVERLPTYAFWIWDGAFSGTINFRHQPGSEELPPYISGHVGYTVVPWKRNRGYATKALGLVLPVARAAGMARVLLTCDPENLASRQVIEANGGVASGSSPHPWAPGRVKLLYWVPTGPAGGISGR